MCVDVIGVFLGNKKGCDGLIHPGFSNYIRVLGHMTVNTLVESELCWTHLKEEKKLFVTVHVSLSSYHLLNCIYTEGR